MSIVDPAADHMEEMHSDCEVQALFPSADEEPQTNGTVKTVRQVILLVMSIVSESIHNKSNDFINRFKFPSRRAGM